MRAKNPSNFDSDEVSVETHGYYGSTVTGAFATIMEDDHYVNDPVWVAVNWFTCREGFHRAFPDDSVSKNFLFCHRKGRAKNVALFIEKIEERLDVKPRSQFGMTDKNNIIWVRPSGWWVSRSMRRSLFTIFLRAGQDFNRTNDNFDTALYKSYYARDTLYAVNRFLKGYTRYTGRVQGWHNQFGANWWDDDNKPSQKKVRELLIKPV